MISKNSFADILAKLHSITLI